MWCTCHKGCWGIAQDFCLVAISHVVEQCLVGIIVSLHLVILNRDLFTMFSLGAIQFAVILSLTPCARPQTLCWEMPASWVQMQSTSCESVIFGKIQRQGCLMQEMGSGWTQWGLKTSSINGRGNCPSPPSNCTLAGSPSQSQASL